MVKFGIDISHLQSNINLTNARNSEGVSFAIIKAGGGDAGLYQDDKFDDYYNKAKQLSLPVGAYFIGHAFSEEEAADEADKFIQIVEGKQFEYPLYYGIKGDMILQDKDTLTLIVEMFCERLKVAGYCAGIYAPLPFYDNVDDAKLASYAHWVAKCGTKKPTLKSGIMAGIWQYGREKNYIRSNRVTGVVCNQNYCYINYPRLIKAAGLNGFASEATAKSSAEEETQTKRRTRRKRNSA